MIIFVTISSDLIIDYFIVVKAAEMTAALTPQQKVEWATCQRKEGNRLFAKSEYQEAMDVYLTCLVAIDSSNEPFPKDEYDVGTDENNVGDTSMQFQCDTEIKLPVLLNLALCALKLGMLSKAEKFCNYAIELEPGQQSAKAYFRRGKVRMLMGNYISAELDLDQALDLLHATTADEPDYKYDDTENKDRKAILREKQKLQQLIKQAEKNQQIQKKAMERLFQSSNQHKNEAEPTMLNVSGTESQQNEKPDNCYGLYPEKKSGTRKYSTLREDPDWDHSIVVDDDSKVDETSHSLQKYLEWYLQMIGRGAQKILDMIGEEENDLATTSATGAAKINTIGHDKSCKVD